MPRQSWAWVEVWGQRHSLSLSDTAPSTTQRGHCGTAHLQVSHPRRLRLDLLPQSLALGEEPLVLPGVKWGWGSPRHRPLGEPPAPGSPPPVDPRPASTGCAAPSPGESVAVRGCRVTPQATLHGTLAKPLTACRACRRSSAFSSSSRLTTAFTSSSSSTATLACSSACRLLPGPNSISAFPGCRSRPHPREPLGSTFAAALGAARSPRPGGR